MGNTLKTGAPKHRSSSSKKGRRPMEDLSGFEITCDQDDVSEIFTMPESDRRGGKDMKDTSHTAIYGPRSSCRSNCTSDKMRRSRRSSAGGADADEDLAACIIPGMDPLEMLKLVEQCQNEEIREKELEESVRGQKRRLSRRHNNKRAIKGRTRKRHAFTSGAA